MQKVRTEEQVIEQNYYDFYCDCCGKFINTSMECDDGGYYAFGKTTGMLKLSNESNKTRLQFRIELCPECYDSLVHEMDTVINDVLQKYGATAVITTSDGKRACFSDKKKDVTIKGGCSNDKI